MWAGAFRVVIGIREVCVFDFKRHPSPLASVALLACAVAASAPASASPLPKHTDTSSIDPDRSAIECAIDRVSQASAHPARTRGTLLARIRNSPACYPDNLTEQQWEELLINTQLLPPTQSRVQPAFFVDSFSWLGDGAQGQSNTSRRANLTYSFVADGTNWGVSCGGSGPMPSTLDAALVTTFGNLDRGREFFRSSLASWRRYAGLSYSEVADDASPQDLLTARNPARGDVRIGGAPLGTGTSAPLAYNTFPSNLGSFSCSGGDMFINTSYFTPSFLGSSNGNYLYLRNAVAHEHGHGLGLKHVVPCNRTKLMEPQVSTLFVLQSYDELRAVLADYGDRFSGNHTSATAVDFGNLTSPSVRSVIEKDLGVNGTVVLVDNVQVAQNDWFKFTLSSSASVEISVTPTGGSYQNEQQFSACIGVSDPQPAPTINASEAGNMALQVLSPTFSVLHERSSNPVGQSESVTATLSAGTYFIRVWDSGGANAANQKVQSYDLKVMVDGANAPPKAIAGLNKRVLADTTCQFIGNHNSYATMPGASIPVSGYAWDLDGNGTFENVGNSQPTITYLSNGVYNVSLRVTDTLGTTGTDTIQVTVHGATTEVTGVNPASGSAGTTVPVSIIGSNFKGVTSAGQVTVSGSGVSVTGTPAVNPLGTQITGLSLVIAPGAPAGPRTVLITNSDGLGTSGNGIDVFSVGGATPTGACCATSGACSVIAQASCVVPSTYQGNGTSCTPNPCVQPTGACCQSSGMCAITTQLDCVLPGVFQGASTVCSPNPCPQPTGACCESAGVCTLTTLAGCAGLGTYQGNATTCTPNPCPQPTGACCTPAGWCTVVIEASCIVPNEFLGSGAPCVPNPCSPQTGACCTGSTCAVSTAAACTGTNTRFAGAGTACNVAGNTTTPCCVGDFNASGLISVDDIFAYLDAWFTMNPQADTDRSGTVNVQDIFDFLAAWFAGC